MARSSIMVAVKLWGGIWIAMLAGVSHGQTPADAAGNALGPNGPLALAALAPAEAYNRCLALARTAPDAAARQAADWHTAGGGHPAQHCGALALVEAGDFGDAAIALEALAASMTGFEPAARAAVLGQAGRAWLQANRTSRAYAAITAGLTLTPDDVELLIDRSEALAATEKYWDSLDDLNRALELDPKRVDALVFRATAYRLVDALDLARDNLDQALALNPRNPDALLELGIVRRLDGDAVGAASAWQQVVQAAPGSPAAITAQVNLARLDDR